MTPDCTTLSELYENVTLDCVRAGLSKKMKRSRKTVNSTYHGALLPQAQQPQCQLALDQLAYSDPEQDGVHFDTQPIVICHLARRRARARVQEALQDVDVVRVS